MKENALLPVGTILALVSLLPSKLISAPDTVDPVFSASAGQLFDPAATGGVSSVLVQPDGKILFGSNEMPGDFDGSTRSTALTRFNPDGTVDSFFFADNEPNGSDAGIYFDDTGYSETHALGLQSDGKIIAAGAMQGVRIGTAASPTLEFRSNSIVRFNADGTIDPTFQTNGTAPSTGFNYIEDVTIGPDDKIYAAGGFGGFRDNEAVPYATRYGIARLNANGSLDTGFVVDSTEFGVPSTASNLSGFFREVEVAPSGKIYLAGSFQYGFGFPQTTIPVVARVFPNGRLDTAFNASLPADAEAITGIELEPDGRLVVLGYTDLFQTESFMIRLNSDGSLDPSFNLDASLTRVSARPLERDAAGRYLLTAPNTAGDAPLGALIRVTSTGAIDPTFRAEATDTSTSFFNTFTTGANGKIYAGSGGSTEINGVGTIKLVGFEGDALPATLAWTSTSITPAESIGSLILSVTRSGDLSTAASVAYATAPGSATGSDFTATSGVLTWAPGVGGEKTFTVPLIDDAIAESDETFTVTLSSASGAGIVAPAAVTVTIFDDDSAPVILTPPAALTVRVGEAASFSVAVSSPVPPTYQWRKNNSDIPGATAAVYAIPSTDLDDEADYSVVVSGAVQSASARLTVVPPAAAVDPAFSYSGVTQPGQFTFLADDSFLVLDGNFAIGYTLKRLDSAFEPVPSFSVTTTPLSGFGAASAYPTPIPLPDGRFLATGQFETINGVTRPRLARLDANGTVDSSFNPFFNGSFTVNGFNAFFSSLSGTTVTGDGEVYLMVKTSNQGSILARLLEDGSLDPTFSTAVNYSTNGFLYALRELPDGSLLISYTSGSGGSFQRGLRKLHPDGSIDTSFASLTSLFPAPADIELIGDDRFAIIRGSLLEIYDLDGIPLSSHTFSGTLTSIEPYRGRLLVSGATGFGDLTLPGLALFSPDGTVDDNFPGGAGPNGTVSQVLTDSQGRLVVRGNFTTWSGSAAPSLTRLLVERPELGFAASSLSIDEDAGPVSFAVVRYGDTSAAASVRIRATAGTALEPSDYAAVDQVITWAAGDGTPKSVSLTPVDDSDIESAETFILTLSEATGATAIPIDATITILDDDSRPKISAQPEETFAVLGKPASLSVAATSPTTLSYQWFLGADAIPGATAATYTIASVSAGDVGDYRVRLTNDEATIFSDTVPLILIADPAALAPGFVAPTALTGLVNALAPTPDGGVYVGGNFLNVAGEPNRDYLVRLDANGVLDTSFNPPVLNGQVRDLVLQPDGKLVVVGGFSSVTGSLNRRIIRLDSEGSLDSVFSTASGTGPNGEVHTVALEPDGSILIGGSFSAYGSTNLLNGHDLVRLTPDGAYASRIFADFNTIIHDILVLPDGDILAAFNTNSSSANKVLRLNPDLQRDTSLTYASGRSRVDRMALAADGSFLFTALNGFYKVTAAGDIESTIATGNYGAVVTQVNGKILAASTTSPRIFRYLSDGTPDPIFNLSSAANSTVASLALRPDGKIWAGGIFTSINGTTVNYVALLNGDPIPLAFTAQPVGRTVVDPGEDVTLSVAATGTSTITYQWLRDGDPLSDGPGISGSETDTLSLTAVDEADGGIYTVEISNEAGTRTSDNSQVVILGAPQILSLSEDLILLEGNPLTLEVEALGAGILEYQWFKGSSPLTSQTSATLSISPASETDAGSYSVVITNAIDSTTSDSIAVTVLPNAAAIAPGFTLPTVTGGSVNQILPLSGGRALIGGAFSSISDGINTSGARLALVDESGAVILVDGLSADGTVESLRLQSDGKILVAGAFNTIGGTARGKLARLDADLALDATFNPTGLTGAFTSALDLAQEAGDTLIAVGNFANFGGEAGTAYAVRMNDNGAYNNTFSSAAGNTVYRVFPQPDGDLIFTGWFSWTGSSEQYVVRTDVSGAVDSATDYNTGFLFTSDALQLSNGDVLAANAFTSGVLRLSPAGPAVSPFPIGGPILGVTRGFAESPSGDLLMVGDITSAGGQPAAGIIRLKADGERDLDFDAGTGFDFAINEVDVTSTGRIWVGGGFTQYNGVPTSGLILLKGDVVTPPIDPFENFVALLPEDQRGVSDDPDLDGFPNLLEFVFGTDPASGASVPATVPTGSVQSGTSLNASYSLSLDPAKTYRLIEIEVPVDLMGASITLEASQDLSFSGDATATEVGNPTPNGTTEIRRYVVTPAFEDAKVVFWRFRATR